MAKVEVVSDPECTAIFPSQFPSILRATLYDGSEEVVPVLTNRGGPKRPLSFEELALKFSNNASRLLDPAAVQRVEQLVAGLEQLPSVGPLFEAMALDTANGGHFS